ncbi:MAG TPA: hypothetical protein VHT91_28280 [Kofleriaceae bacterium]|nr:hypothetical protein [Kofleriaceae bacterium]
MFVTEAGQLAGVICAVDLTAAVRDARIETPVAQVMTSPIVAIDVHTEDGHPVGMFTQANALPAATSRGRRRSRPRTTPR